MRPSSLLPRASPCSAPYLRLTSQPTFASRLATQQPCARRQFSQARPRCAQAMGVTVMRGNRGAQQSRDVAMKEHLKQMNRDTFPDDFGMLPGTFVRPVWANLPSIFKDPKGRMQLEWTWLKTRFMNAIGVASFFYMLRGCFTEKIYMRFFGRKAAGKRLHKQMYTALAAGDKETIERICCIGLKNDFFRRIAKRPPRSAPYVWKLHSYVGFPRNSMLGGARVVSDRATLIPVVKQTGVRQIVVRIQSKQSLEKPAATAKVQEKAVAKETRAQVSTEYVVLQKLVFRGVEDPDWKVWGLAQETTLETLASDPYFGPGLSLQEQVQGMTGKTL